MDVLTHSLLGLTSAKAGLERLSPHATIVCLLAANSPDSDVLTGKAVWDRRSSNSRICVTLSQADRAGIFR